MDVKIVLHFFIASFYIYTNQFEEFNMKISAYGKVGINVLFTTQI